MPLLGHKRPAQVLGEHRKPRTHASRTCLCTGFSVLYVYLSMNPLPWFVDKYQSVVLGVHFASVFLCVLVFLLQSDLNLLCSNQMLLHKDTSSYVSIIIVVICGNYSICNRSKSLKFDFVILFV